ncbi:hypothetical protein ALC56_09750 [Trachymyrmex septentrionalis]|uniref:Uncharacterized protein n=1 Tax=Trachymyrmex septentrionalis TaxID=34720 RepID=A0A195F7B2_9HYME|nr:hypothetical protein ALC56_09750 [Trachymyrmex septentrionalis]
MRELGDEPSLFSYSSIDPVPTAPPRALSLQTDTVNDISAGLNLGQGEIGSCCPSRFVLPKLLFDGIYEGDDDVRSVSRLREKILDDGIFSPGHFDRP